MSITFTYEKVKPVTSEEQQAFKAYQEKMAAAAALVSEARAHQWEHKQPIGANAIREEVARRIAIGESAVASTYGQATGQCVGLDAALPPARTFTRAEVLTVLKADMAARASDVRPDEVALSRHLIRVFERME